MNEKINYKLIAILTIVTAIICMGCVETKEPRDSQWISSCSIRIGMVSEDINELQKDLASGNYKRFVESATYLQEDAQIAYDTSIRYTVSPEYETLKTEYELAMLDYIQVGTYSIEGDYDTASKYIESGNQHMDQVNDLLDQLNN
ncbi:MAG: hypothetical protein HF975_04365 [ANME-2 cluster archaeon]|nr:hypothetical protein [ANME-2 cluster archaeon]